MNLLSRYATAMASTNMYPSRHTRWRSMFNVRVLNRDCCAHKLLIVSKEVLKPALHACILHWFRSVLKTRSGWDIMRRSEVLA